MSNFRQLNIQFTPGVAQNPPVLPSVLCPPQYQYLVRTVVADIITILEQNVNASPHMQHMYLLMTNGGQHWATPEFSEAVQLAVAYVSDGQMERNQQLEGQQRRQWVEWILLSLAALETQKSQALQRDVDGNPEWRAAVDNCLRIWGQQNGTKYRIDRAIGWMRSSGIQPTQGAAQAGGGHPAMGYPGYPGAGYPGGGYPGMGHPQGGGYPGGGYPGGHQGGGYPGGPGYPGGGYPNHAMNPGMGSPQYPGMGSHYPQSGYPHGGHPHPAGHGPGGGMANAAFGGGGRPFQSSGYYPDANGVDVGGGGARSARIIDDEDDESH